MKSILLTAILSVSLTLNAVTFWPHEEAIQYTHSEAQKSFASLVTRLNQLPVSK